MGCAGEEQEGDEEREEAGVQRNGEISANEVASAKLITKSSQILVVQVDAAVAVEFQLHQSKHAR